MTSDVSKEFYEKGDNLHNTLLNKLTNPVWSRITKKKKMNHWCLNWSATNLSQMASLTVQCNHVKDDICCLDNNATLLKSSNVFVQVRGYELGQQGTYLHYDNNDMTWIHGGKVTGRGFGILQAEHLNNAKTKSATSRFYMRYPTKDSA